MHLSAAGQEHHAKSYRMDESEQSHEFGIRSSVASGLREELLAIEEDDWQGGDEGGVFLIGCEEDSTRK
jgi:hypothetical protein